MGSSRMRFPHPMGGTALSDLPVSATGGPCPAWECAIGVSYFKCSSLEMLPCSVTSGWDSFRDELDIHSIVRPLVSNFQMYFLINEAEMYLLEIQWVGQEHSGSYVQYSAPSSIYRRGEQRFVRHLAAL